MRAGDLPLPEEVDRASGDVAKEPKTEAKEHSKPIRSSKPPAPDTSAQRPSRQPMVAAPPPVVKMNGDRRVDSSTFLPVRSEELGRYSLHFDYNLSLPTPDHLEYPESPAAAWNLGRSPMLAQNPPASVTLPAQLNTHPPPPDGFLRTLAAMSGNVGSEDLPSVPTMTVPMDMSGGENMLGMWSSVSANMQYVLCVARWKLCLTCNSI